MRKNIQRWMRGAVMTAAALLIASCDNTPKIQVSGAIGQAADSLLIFENMALAGPTIIDSLRLDADGEFAFKAPAPEGSPEFYRLRIGNQIINIAVDSTENITVKANYPTMATGYSIEGNDDCQKIKELALRQMDLQARAQAVAKDPQLTGDQAYLMIFDPQNRQGDLRPFQAVATSWDQFYPNSVRSQNLHNIAMEGLKTQSILRGQGASLEIDASKVSEATLIDLPLADNKGTVRHLTDLTGKVVLLDFHVFSADGSPARIMALRELYNKYHDRGLEIYQVSLDEDEHFWKTQTAALPWISVYDESGARSSAYLTAAPGVPCSFIINRQNEIVMGPTQIKDLDSDIARYL